MVITEPDAINVSNDSLINISNYGGNDGAIYITSTGGSGILNTSWTSNNGFSSSNSNINALFAEYII